jgi:hypothetical protein
MKAGIRATGTVGAQSRTLDESASTGALTGALGGYASAWPAKKLAVHGDFLYIKVTPGSEEASVTDWRLAADYYFFRSAGLGVQYKYNRYSLDRGILSTKLGGELIRLPEAPVEEKLRMPRLSWRRMTGKDSWLCRRSKVRVHSGNLRKRSGRSLLLEPRSQSSVAPRCRRTRANTHRLSRSGPPTEL